MAFLPLAAIRLLLRVRAEAPPSEPEERWLPHPEGALRTLWFRPSAEGQERGTVAVINGYSARGHRDPRMRAVAEALAAGGYTACMPVLEEIEQLRLDAVVPERIGHFLHALAAAEGRPVGLLAASIAAGMSLVAAARPEVRPCLSAVLAIGPYGDLQHTVDHVMLRAGDPYGRYVVWLNFAERVFGPSPTLKAAFRAAIDDDGWRREPPHLPEVLAAGDPLEVALFRRLTGDATFAEMHWREVRARLERDRGFARALDPMAHVSGLAGPVYLLHGARDTVVPPGESLRLAASLRQAGVPGRLVLTPLLTHADAAPPWRAPVHAWRLAGLFQAFLDDVRRDGPRPGRAVRRRIPPLPSHDAPYAPPAVPFRRVGG